MEKRFGNLSKGLPGSFKEFVASSRFGEFKDKNFHFALYPKPYGGNLERADIFLLQLNPGLSLLDYHAEWNEPTYRSILARNLRQDLEGLEFPFISLDPKFCWHPGFRWWESKLRNVCTIVAARKYQGRYYDALRELSRRIAVIELVPYHSIAFGSGGLIRALPSTEMAVQYVTDDLLEKAAAGRALVIAARRVKEWGLRDSKLQGVVTYSSGWSRGSSINSLSPGGRAILNRLGIDI